METALAIRQPWAKGCPEPTQKLEETMKGLPEASREHSAAP